MRKLFTAFVLGLLLAIGAGSAQAQNGVVTFKFTNNAPHIIYIKLYSQNRSWVWPSATSHYVLDDRVEKDARLSCNIGEKICFGGSYSQNDTPRYWGVGYRGNKGCTGCCLTCGSEAEDVWHAWNLVE